MARSLYWLTMPNLVTHHPRCFRGYKASGTSFVSTARPCLAPCIIGYRGSPLRSCYSLLLPIASHVSRSFAVCFAILSQRVVGGCRSLAPRQPKNCPEPSSPKTSKTVSPRNLASSQGWSTVWHSPTEIGSLRAFSELT